MPYPYSSQSHTATASLGPFSYGNVSLLTDVPAKDQLKVYVDGQLKTFTTDYTINTTAETITFTGGHGAVTGTVKIARESDIENKEVTFTNSSVLTAQDLNKNSDQLLFLAQELYDKAQDIAITSVASIADNAVTEAKLNKSAGVEAVTTSTIRDNAVTEAKIGSGAVTEAKIGTDAVTETKILDGSVTTAKIADGDVTTAKIADDAVNNDKMSAGAPVWTAGGDVTVANDLTVTNNAIVDGNLSFDSGFGSTVVAYGCRAWLSFTIPGSATTTYTRTGNTVTVTRNSHGYSNGTYMYIDFGAGTGGTATDGFYQISNVAANTFDITDTASGTITAGTVTAIRAVINAMRNITSVTYVATNEFTIAMTNAMPDSNYVVNVTSHSAGDSRGFVDSDFTMTTTDFRINGAGTILRYSVAVFR